MSERTSELLRLAEGVIDQAKPGEQVEAFVSQGSSTEVMAFGGEVESFTAASSAGIGIRIIQDGRVGFAHAGSLDPEVINETLAEARDNRAFAEPDEWVTLSEPDDRKPIVHDHWDDGVATTPTEDKVQMALDLEAAVMAAMAKDGDAPKIASGFDVNFGPGDLSIEKACDDAVHRVTRLLGATQPNSEKLTMVLEPRMSASLIGILVGMLSGERQIKGRTPFLDRVGEEIASPLLSVTDDPTDDRSFGANSVDGEGQTCRPLKLIENGVFGGFMHNTYTGRRSGEGSTANAVRGVRSTPGVGAHAVIMTPGEGTLDELISGIDDGLLVTSMSGLHSGVNVISGDFSVGVEGLLIRNGQLAEPIREATVASTMQKMLTDIVAVGSEIEWQPGGSGPVPMAIANVSMSGA